MNFFQTVIAVCGGTKVFLRLMNVSPARAILHTVLLVICCTVVMSAGILVPAMREVSTTTARLFEQIGSIDASEDEVRTGKTPNEPKSFLLSSTNGFRFDYLPGTGFNPEAAHAQGGLLIYRNGMVLWAKELSTENRFRAIYFSAERLHSLLRMMNTGNGKQDDEGILKEIQQLTGGDGGTAGSNLNAEQFASFLRRNGVVQSKHTEAHPVAQKEAGEEDFETLNSAGLVSSSINVNLGVLVVLGSTIMITVLLALTAVFFLLTQNIRIKMLPNRISGRNALVIVLYSSYPALIIATLGAAFVVPLFSYQLIFFICYFLYQMLAFNTVLKELNPPPPEDDDADF